MRRLRASLVMVVALGAVGTGLAGCAGTTGAEADEPTAPDGGFVPGKFAGLPKPTDAFPLGDPAVEPTTIAQSFQVTGASPEDILSFYEAELPGAGWEPSTPPAEVGDGDWRGTWARDGETLEVSASPFQGEGVTSQLDLVLTR